jgi:hypothetical protein
LQKKIEVPSGRDAQIVIGAIIPVVVDIETTVVEVADVDTVAVRVNALCLFSSKSPKIEIYFLLEIDLYSLSFVFNY